MERGLRQVGEEIVYRSMQIELEVPVAATPEVVFDALTVRVGSWWTMTFQTSATVVLEPWEGGRFFESWREGAASSTPR